MAPSHFIKLFLCFILFSNYRIKGADVFETFFFRFDCYQDEQPGCSTDFTDAYPQYAWSYINLTKATTRIYLFTNKNKDNPELLHKCGGQLPPHTKFNSKCKTLFFIHGLVTGICNMGIFKELKNQFFIAGCFNIIMVDWTWGNIFDLNDIRNNFPIVASQIAIVIDNLKAKYNLDACDIELFGHSFGAHIAGLVGQRTRICKITGADPSGVIHTENTPLDERLDAGDATCVQVIHTNGGQCLPNYVGANFSCGTVDFWVNGGMMNPSCRTVTLQAFLKADWVYGFLSLFPFACSHLQSLQFYKASIMPSNCQFLGVKCDSTDDAKKGKCPNTCGPNGENCEVMGAYGCDSLLRNKGKTEPLGNYYVKTDLSCPYCDNTWLNLNSFTRKQEDVL